MDEENELTIAICKYIYTNWVSKAKSQRDFASKCDIEESTIRKIKNIALGTAKAEYNMSIKTLAKICRKKEITLEEFFRTINK